MTAQGPEPSVGRFFGGALITMGFLMMLLCGGCGAVFLVLFVISGLASSNPEDLAMAIIPIAVGGLPALVGFGLYLVGRRLRPPAKTVRPPPSALPPD
jgi:hypothetical protein